MTSKKSYYREEVQKPRILVKTQKPHASEDVQKTPHSSEDVQKYDLKRKTIFLNNHFSLLASKVCVSTPNPRVLFAQSESQLVPLRGQGIIS